MARSEGWCPDMLASLPAHSAALGLAAAIPGPGVAALVGQSMAGSARDAVPAGRDRARRRDLPDRRRGRAVRHRPDLFRRVPDGEAARRALPDPSGGETVDQPRRSGRGRERAGVPRPRRLPRRVFRHPGHSEDDHLPPRPAADGAGPAQHRPGRTGAAGGGGDGAAGVKIPPSPMPEARSGRDQARHCLAPPAHDSSAGDGGGERPQRPAPARAGGRWPGASGTRPDKANRCAMAKAMALAKGAGGRGRDGNRTPTPIPHRSTIPAGQVIV